MSRRAHSRRSLGARFGDRLGASAIRSASWLLQRLPDACGIAGARFAAVAWYGLDARHRRVVDENLRLAFGNEMSAPERRRVARAVFRNIAHTAVEFLTMPRWTFDRDIVSMIDLKTLERLDEVLAEGKGAILLAAHFGNWELMAGGAALRGMPIAAVARPVDQPAINAAITAIRESTGLKVIQRRAGALGALRTLRKGGLLGVLADQNTRKDPVFAEFFGRPAATTPAPAFLALKTGAPILPCYLIRIGERRFALRVEPRLVLSQTGDFDRDVWVNTQRCAAELERMVRCYPDNWFWVHRRWKTQPPEGWTPPHVPQAETVSTG